MRASSSRSPVIGRMRKTASSGTSRGAGTPAHHTTAATSPVTAPSPWIAVAVIGWRALRAAARTENVFLSHLILGLSSLLMVQTLFNVAVVLGLGVWSARDFNGYNAYYWQMGMNGAMFQMIAHGISSAGMFFMVGVLYDRVHHRNLNEFGGMFNKMPVHSGLAIGIFFA